MPSNEKQEETIEKQQQLSSDCCLYISVPSTANEEVNVRTIIRRSITTTNRRLAMQQQEEEEEQQKQQQ